MLPALGTPDHLLTIDEKIELIEAIPLRQAERWARLKKFHSLDASLHFKHYFMQQVINLIRSQQQRLKALKQSIYG